MTRPTIITIAPAPQVGCYSATVDGRALVESSRTPFLDAARVMLADGFSPAAKIIMRHAGSDVDCLTATIGGAARLTVTESELEAPRFRRWRAFPSRPVGPPIEQMGARL